MQPAMGPELVQKSPWGVWEYSSSIIIPFGALPSHFGPKCEKRVKNKEIINPINIPLSDPIGPVWAGPIADFFCSEMQPAMLSPHVDIVYVDAEGAQAETDLEPGL